MTRFTLIFLTLALALTGCSKDAGKTDAAAGNDAAATLLIAPQDLVSVQNNALSAGPSITGSVQPQRRADLRAEVSSVVMQVLKDNGDRVHRGDLLERLDDTA